MRSSSQSSASVRREARESRLRILKTAGLEGSTRREEGSRAVVGMEMGAMLLLRRCWGS